MHDDLVFLASSHVPQCRGVLDKYLIGYSTIQFMEEGGIWIAYDETEFEIEGAWFWPAHPGPRIRWHVDSGYRHWSHRHIGFQGALVNRWAAMGLWLTTPQPAPANKTSDQWAAFFDEMIFYSRRTDHWSRLRAINMIENLLIEIAEARTATPQRDPWLGEVLQRLALSPPPDEQAQSPAPPDYETLATELGMSTGTLRRRFKAATGTSLHNFVLQSRIATARTLLSETDLPLKTIAARLGYNNVYFFSRQFRELAGVSPGHYRKSR